MLATAQKPLVIVGKGAAYDQSEKFVFDLIHSTGLPWLPTPMGKGVMPDTHPGSVAKARTMALQEADVILLLGARLNWILHFGRPPRFNKNVVFVQVRIWSFYVFNSSEVNNHLGLSYKILPHFLRLVAGGHLPRRNGQQCQQRDRSTFECRASL